jgi:hypothetical protein
MVAVVQPILLKAKSENKILLIIVSIYFESSKNSV